MGTITDPASIGVEVIPNDSTDISATGHMCRGIYVGTGGNLAILMSNDSSVVFANVASGSLLPLRTKRILSTGTTASDIVALF